MKPKKEDLHIRLSENRKEKLKAYADSKEKTVTQLIEGWIDTLPDVKEEDAKRY